MSKALRFALLGDPVEHSRSPIINRAALDQAGLIGEYHAVKADETRLELEAQKLRAGGLDGINVTMPLKRQAAALADVLTPEAADSGSVNTLRAREGAIEGHSTDVTAFRQILVRDGFREVAEVLVLGGGGAALAALASLEGHRVYTSARRRDQASLLGAGVTGVVTWGTAVAGALLINATPIGMEGNALPAGLVEASAGVIDLAYDDGPTPAIARAEKLGIPHVDGVEFLVLAAAASFQWWTGAVVDSELLLATARNA